VRAQQEAKRTEWRQAELDKVVRRDAPKETMRKKVANARADGRGEAAGRVRLQERLWARGGAAARHSGIVADVRGARKVKFCL
jgi:hypothetical protein